MKKTLKLGVFLLGLGVAVSSVSFVAARPGEINIQRVLMHNLTIDEDVATSNITPNPDLLTNDNIHGIRVESNSFDITVKSGDQYSVNEIDRSDSALFESNVIDHQLVVGQKSSKANKSLSGTTRIEVTVPSNVKLDNITVQSKYGDITLRQVYANQVQLTNTDGDIHLNQVNIDGGGSVTNDSGDIDVVQGQLPILEAQTKTGYVSMKRAYHIGYGDAADLHLTAKAGDIILE